MLLITVVPSLRTTVVPFAVVFWISLFVTLLAFCCYVAGIATAALIREPQGRALDEVSEDLSATPA
jgi:hypothetical protein